MDTDALTACQRQARQVQQELEKLLLLLADADPHQRMTTAAELRQICDELLVRALITGMADARTEGWGLRRIAEASRYSHEQVRTLLAQAVER